MCDFLSGYAGAAPACTQCTKSQIFDFENIQCVDCGTGAIRNAENECACDYKNGYAGEPENCALCPPEEIATKEGTCTCNAALGYVPNPYGESAEDPRCFRCSGDEYVAGGRCVACESGMEADAGRAGCVCSEALGAAAGGACTREESADSSRKYLEYYASEQSPHEVRISGHLDARLAGIARERAQTVKVQVTNAGELVVSSGAGIF